MFNVIGKDIRNIFFFISVDNAGRLLSLFPVYLGNVRCLLGYAVAQLVEALRYKPVDSASNRNEYQESFLGVKTAGA
jgi:hypothetical protein